MSEKVAHRRRMTRERILEASRQLFGQLGYHETQVMDIVRAVGMSAGTFYNHFRDKRDLFQILAEENVDHLRQQLQGIRESLDVTDRAERRARLRESFEAFFDHIDEHPQEVVMLLRGDAAGSDAPRLDIFEVARMFGHDLARDAERWVLGGVASRRSPELFAHAVIGMSLQVMQAYLVEGRYGREEAVDGLLEMTLAVFDECFEIEKAGA